MTDRAITPKDRAASAIEMWQRAYAALNGMHAPAASYQRGWIKIAYPSRVDNYRVEDLHRWTDHLWARVRENQTQIDSIAIAKAKSPTGETK